MNRQNNRGRKTKTESEPHSMNSLIQFKPTIPRNSAYDSPRKEQLRRTQALRMVRDFLLILLLACFALASAPTAFGVVPAPVGGYPGGNTAEGDNELLDLTTGANNTAIGQDALFSNTTGSNNTANGVAALADNTTGSFNTANGVDALFGNTIGTFNTADGFLALSGNTTGSFNTANGAAALQNNTTGSDNTAAGTQALNKNITGSNNTADGFQALLFNATGFEMWPLVGAPSLETQLDFTIRPMVFKRSPPTQP